MDTRLEAIKLWLTTGPGLKDFHIEPASADASFRRYFRVQSGDTSYIVMDAPPAQEDCTAFIAVSALMHERGLHVPEVLETDLQQGFLLLTDLGQRLYLAELNATRADALYGDAMQALVCLQAAGPARLPPYDRELLMAEMALFPDWYVARHLQHTLTGAQQAVLGETFEFLCTAALQQPQVVVHRDYHSRNLMISEPNPGILDFQDAVMGAVTYDLVSLLRDCYIKWPAGKVDAWARQYHRMASDAGILDGIDVDTFLRGFDLMGLQRHIKVAGIFARLNYRDGKAGYLEDIPMTLAYIREVGSKYPEMAAFMELLEGFPVVTNDEIRGAREGG